MSLTALPTKTDESLGREKRDNLPEGVSITDLELDYAIPAAEHEQIKDVIIAIAGEVGVHDEAGGPYSLNTRVRALEDGGAGTYGSVEDVGRATSDGVATTAARSDHVHDGGVVVVSATKTANYTIQHTDEIVLVDTTSGAIELTLPSPLARRYMVQKVGGGTNKITLKRYASEKIQGTAASYDLPGSEVAFASSSPQAWMVYANGTDWWVA